MSPTPKRRKRSQPIEKWCSYYFRIERLLAHYSLGPGSDFEPTAYAEHLQTEIEAVCLSPAKFEGRLTKFTIIGNRNLERDLWMQEHAPINTTGIGTLTMRGDQSDYLGSMPHDVVWQIQSHILAGSFRFISLHGNVIRHGRARISWMGFDTLLDPDNL